MVYWQFYMQFVFIFIFPSIADTNVIQYFHSIY